MRESAVEKAICVHAKSKNFLVYKFISPGHNGVPDRVYVSPDGVVAFMEVKAPGKKPSALQERELSILRNRGLWADWFDSADKAKRWLDLILAAE